MDADKINHEMHQTLPIRGGEAGVILIIVGFIGVYRRPSAANS
jgi:hypothetical protein